jgi:hypothetical protein
VTSCLISEEPWFDCGFTWTGMAQDAFGDIDSDAESIRVGEGEPSEWVTKDACMPPAADAILAEGALAQCWLHNPVSPHNTVDVGNACAGATGCGWVNNFTLEGRSAAVCIYDDDDYEDAFRFVAERVLTECLAEADRQGITPYLSASDGL